MINPNAYRIYTGDTGSLLLVLYETASQADAERVASAMAKAEGRPMRLNRGAERIATFAYLPPEEEG